MKKAFLLIFIFLLMPHSTFGQDNIKTPNVSGQFYEADAGKLSGEIDRMLSLAKIVKNDKNIEVVIAPHAGYIYSGPVAAYSFKAVSQKKYSTIIVIGVSHFVDFEGISIWPEGAFETPLGQIPVDADFSKNLMNASDRIKAYPPAFTREHSLEVELPFLQKTFKDFKLVALLTGRPKFDDCQFLADALDKIIGNRKDILIVISTDMSHYHDDKTARQMDFTALSLVKNLDAAHLWQDMFLKKIEFCGFPGVTTALLYAKKRGLEPEILKYGNSGDATGDKTSVVGYGAVVFYGDNGQKNGAVPPKSGGTAPNLSTDQQKRLLHIARETLTNFIQNGKVTEYNESGPRLLVNEGAFVTLRKNGQLRGCIGNIIGKKPLYETVRDMAIAAATQDPRFKPVDKGELQDLEIEISVLSVPHKINNVSEIVLGRHGVIVSQGSHTGVFLPQVATETHWDKNKFLSVLCAEKAGLPPDAWKDPRTTIEIFTAQVFEEKDFK